MYNVITTSCSDSEIRDELVHLFRGCSESCCRDRGHYVTVPTPTSNAVFAAGSGVFVMSSQVTRCFLDLSTTSPGISSSSGGMDSITTPGSDTRLINSSTSSSGSSRLTTMPLTGTLWECRARVCKSTHSQSHDSQSQSHDPQLQLHDLHSTHMVYSSLRELPPT